MEGQNRGRKIRTEKFNYTPVISPQSRKFNRDCISVLKNPFFFNFLSLSRQLTGHAGADSSCEKLLFIFQQYIILITYIPFARKSTISLNMQYLSLCLFFKNIYVYKIYFQKLIISSTVLYMSKKNLIIDVLLQIRIDDTAFEKYRKRDVNKPYQELSHIYLPLFFRC